MIEAVKYITIGYLSGSILFARVCAKLMNKPAILQESRDGNPGTANAFKYGGFICGIITLIGDVIKGFLPVFVYWRYGESLKKFVLVTALVLAAPVLGHAFSIFSNFQGGKGIAVTFGCLLGIFPEFIPVLIFAMLFIFFSLILRITPHFTRTIVTYIAALFMFFCLRCSPGILLGFGLMSATVMLRLHMSKEDREKPEVKLFWIS